MRCYDCAVAQQDMPAVAICATCGAGVCMTHAVLGHRDEMTVTVGIPSAVRIPGRVFLCQTCSATAAAAEAATPAGQVVDAPNV